MAKFFTAEVDLDWYLEMFEKHSGQRIKRTQTWGYRNQGLYIYLADAEANRRFSSVYPNDVVYQLSLDLDTGELEFCKLRDECVRLSVAGVYASEHPSVEVMEVRPKYNGWRLVCRQEKSPDDLPY